MRVRLYLRNRQVIWWPQEIPGRIAVLCTPVISVLVLYKPTMENQEYIIYSQLDINTGMGNFIIQGGEITTSMNNVEQNFPCAFSTKLIGFAISQSGGSSGTISRVSHMQKPTLTTFNLFSGESAMTTYGAYWIAIGQ